MNNEQRIMIKGGSLPGCMAEQQAQLATRPLTPASSVAALPAGSSATPSAGDSPRLHGRAASAACDQAATPLAWCSEEVRHG